MDSSITDWAQVKGAMYMDLMSGATYEIIWTAIAVAVCIIALVMGSAHEKKAYEAARQKAK